jgi:hypothetical protein
LYRGDCNGYCSINCRELFIFHVTRVAVGAEGGCLELVEACAAKMQHRVKEERRKKKEE